jgi:hypothetical protein
MKMYANVAIASLFLVSSSLLQGCSFGFKDEDDRGPKRRSRFEDEDEDDRYQNRNRNRYEDEEDKEVLRMRRPATKKGVADEEASAQCTGGGDFSCSGNWKSWCAKQQKKCAAKMGETGGSKSCMPQCSWECENKKCDQVCAPKCAPALCSTRCKKVNPKNCHMNCGSQNCHVVCPKHFCPGKKCAACKTECGRPVCKAECNKPEDAPCLSVCAQPKCKWECNKPTECPKPVCDMKCEKPKDCMTNMNYVSNLPPLEPGETEISEWHTQKAHASSWAPAPAPAAARALLQTSMRVDITTMGKDFKLQTSHVDLQMAPMDASTSWVAMVRKHHGHMKESEASCSNGKFQCNGNANWCKHQQAVVCPVAESKEVAADAFEADAESVASQTLQAAGADEDQAFLQQRSHTQGHLRA